MIRPDWTPAEDAVIREHPANKEAAKLLGRSFNAVKTRRRRIGAAGTGKKTWTKAEDAVLKKHRDDPLSKYRKKLPGRTDRAINTRRCELRLVKDKPQRPWSTADVKKLREEYPNATAARLRELFPGRTGSSVRAMASYYGIRSEPKLEAPVHDILAAIRRRAREDGIAMIPLCVELGLPSDTLKRKSIDMNRAAALVAYFGGRLVVDWQDE